MSATTLEELAEKAGAAALNGHRAIVDAARALANEVDITGARRRLADALAGLDVAREKVRLAVLTEQDAKGVLANEEAEAEWTLDDRFVTEGNKTFLVIADDDRRQMTADERKAWKAGAAKRMPEVQRALANLRHASQQAGAARDALATAEDRFRAAMADLRAACAHLDLFAAVFPSAGTHR